MSHPAAHIFKDIVNPHELVAKGIPNRIWVFGGQINSNSNAPLSIRDQFLRVALTHNSKWAKELITPESYDDWLSFSGYKDLLIFERDACYLSRFIILFLESPGAIAELGAFALDDYIYNKIFLIVADEYRTIAGGSSFINLGPINRIESIKNRSHKGICVIGSKKINELRDDEIQLIFEEVELFQSQFKHHATEKFRKEDPTHQLLLVADIVDLLQVSNLEEIQDLLDFLEVPYSTESLKQSLSLLRFLNLIQIIERGSKPFYVRRRDSIPLIDYEGKSKEKKFERLSFKQKSNEYVQSDIRRSPLLEKLK